MSIPTLMYTSCTRVCTDTTQASLGAYLAALTIEPGSSWLAARVRELDASVTWTELRKFVFSEEPSKPKLSVYFTLPVPSSALGPGSVTVEFSKCAFDLKARVVYTSRARTNLRPPRAPRAGRSQGASLVARPQPPANVCRVSL